MKKKWIVYWWNDVKDKQDSKGFDTYEEAITHAHKITDKHNVRARVELA